MNPVYVTVKCPRCSSTLEIISSGITTDIFLCPVCLEGEIQCKEQRHILNKESGHDQLAGKSDQNVTAVGTFTTNWRQERENRHAKVVAEVFSLWRTGLHLN